MIPFLDLKSVNERDRQDFRAAFERVLDSGWLIQGGECAAFESEFAAYCGAGHAVGVANGLDALMLTLRAWDIGPGDEVIVPSNTFIATWLAVSYVGATPVPVEPALPSYNIDGETVRRAITPRTRAVIPVHLYGRPAEMQSVMAVAEAHDLKVLEDAAQAHGAHYRGRRAGALGHAAAFSFYPGKNLGALGDGGAVVTDDSALAARIRMIANYGSARKYVHDEAGVNSRLDEMQAAFLRVKLRRLDADNAARAAVAARYLAGMQGLGLDLPQADDAQVVSSWHLFVVRHPRRDELARRLADANVATLIHYPTPPHLQGAYFGRSAAPGTLPVSEAIHAHVLSLPMAPTLSTADADAVVAAVRSTV